MARKSYSDREKAEAYVYGLKATGASEYFYIGSTKFDPEERLKQHLDVIRLGYNRNRHFANKAKQIGLARIRVEVIEETTEAERFDREYHWIDSCKKSGMRLVNIVTRANEYSETRKMDEYLERVSSPAFCRQAIYDLLTQSRVCADPRNQPLVDKLMGVAEMLLLSALTNHYDGLMEFLASDA